MFTIIVGGGQVGSYLATLLNNAGHQVKIIEIRKDRVDRLRQVFSKDHVVLGSGTDPNLLESAGINQADVVAAITGADETNLVICSLARAEFNVHRIIARVNNPKNAWLFTPEMGVDVALNQADLLAHLIVEEMSLGDMMTLLKLRKGQFSLIEEKVHATSTAAGKPVRELNLPSQCILAAIIRNGELVVPKGDTVLEASDEVLAVVHTDDLPALDQILGPAR